MASICRGWLNSIFPYTPVSIGWRWYTNNIWATQNLSTCADRRNNKMKRKEKIHWSPVTCYLSPVTCHLSPFTGHLSPVTCQLSPVTCHLSVVTCHLSPVIYHMSPSNVSIQIIQSADPALLTPKSCILGWFTKTETQTPPQKNFKMQEIAEHTFFTFSS